MMIDRLSEMKEIKKGSVLHMQDLSDNNIYLFKVGFVTCFFG